MLAACMNQAQVELMSEDSPGEAESRGLSGEDQAVGMEAQYKRRQDLGAPSGLQRSRSCGRFEQGTGSLCRVLQRGDSGYSVKKCLEALRWEQGDLEKVTSSLGKGLSAGPWWVWRWGCIQETHRGQNGQASSEGLGAQHRLPGAPACPGPDSRSLVSHGDLSQHPTRHPWPSSGSQALCSYFRCVTWH